jgi:hypothetical protein
VYASPSKGDVEFTIHSRGRSVSARPTKAGKSSSPAPAAVAPASASAPAADWFHAMMRRVLEVGKQHMRLTLRLSRFDLQLDISSLLDLAARLLNRLQLLSQSAAKTAQAAREAALSPTSPRGISRSPTQNSESLAAAETTSQVSSFVFVLSSLFFVQLTLEMCDSAFGQFATICARCAAANRSRSLVRNVYIASSVYCLICVFCAQFIYSGAARCIRLSPGLHTR